MKFSLLVLSLFTLIAPVAQADVFGKQGEILKVVRAKAAGETMISFEYCDKRNNCKFLGPKQYYRESELKDQKVTEGIQVGLSGVASVAAVVGGAYAGSVLLPAGATVAMGGGFGSLMFIAMGKSVFTMLGGSLGLVTGALSVVNIEPINPIAQWRQARSIRDKVLADEEIHLWTKNGMPKFVKAMETVLEKL